MSCLSNLFNNFCNSCGDTTTHSCGCGDVTMRVVHASNGCDCCGRRLIVISNGCGCNHCNGCGTCGCNG